jgi:hypothetical protein
MKRIFFLRSWVIFPLLLSIYPPLNLLAYNIQYIHYSEALRAFIVCLAVALILLLILKLILHDGNKAALVLALLWILFFTYGHTYNYLEQHQIFGLSLAGHRKLIPMWLVLAGVGMLLILRQKRPLAGAIRTLTWTTALLLMVFPIWQVGFYTITNAIAWSTEAPKLEGTEALHLPPGETPPDIYYIILDSYLRQDVLQKYYNYDNSPLLGSLEDMGFRVMRCSQSNYAWTELSLTSSLNMDYLQTISSNTSSEFAQHAEVRRLYHQSAVRRILKELGYKMVAFETGFYWTEVKDADFYISPTNIPGGLNNFELILVKTSAGLILFDAAPALPGFLDNSFKNPDRIHRERVLYSLDKLDEIPTSIPGPKFVFAHIVAPHNPYVFDQDGNEVSYPEDKSQEMREKAYFDELIYINKRVSKIINDILINSSTPPIIIVQSDHGIYWTSPSDRLRILNAYYLPGADTAPLYVSISPVNSFRIIFNEYFGGSYPLLANRSYYSPSSDRFHYNLMPNICR